MPAIIPAIILFLLTGEAGAAQIKCQPTPPQANEQVSWRTIDGRRCWYIGPRKIDKSLLFWEPEKPLEIEEMPLPTPAPPIRAEELPSEFQDRWDGLYDHRTARDPQPMQQWRLWE
jgi:hypothetical protein